MEEISKLPLRQTALIMVVAFSSWAQPLPVHAADDGDAPRWNEMRIQIEEYRQGKRSDEDAFVLLRRMLRHCGATKSTATTECQSLISDWRRLRERRPDLVQSPPQETTDQKRTREESDARNKARTRALETRAASFVPKDDRGHIFWSGSLLAVFFQYRAEFYSLPPGVKCQVEFGGRSVPVQETRFQGIADRPRFSRVGVATSLVPRKVIHFAAKISTPLRIVRKAESYEAVAVNSVLLHAGYSPNDDEERAMTEYLAQHGKDARPSVPQTALSDFYGVIGIDGTIRHSIQFRGQSPSPLLVALMSLQDGTSHFGKGRAVNPEHGDAQSFGDVTQVLSWLPGKPIVELPTREALTKYAELRDLPWLK